MLKHDQRPWEKRIAQWRIEVQRCDASGWAAISPGRKKGAGKDCAASTILLLLGYLAALPARLTGPGAPRRQEAHLTVMRKSLEVFGEIGPRMGEGPGILAEGCEAARFFPDDTSQAVLDLAVNAVGLLAQPTQCGGKARQMPKAADSWSRVTRALGDSLMEFRARVHAALALEQLRQENGSLSGVVAHIAERTGRPAFVSRPYLGHLTRARMRIPSNETGIAKIKTLVWNVKAWPPERKKAALERILPARPEINRMDANEFAAWAGRETTRKEPGRITLAIEANPLRFRIKAREYSDPARLQKQVHKVYRMLRDGGMKGEIELPESVLPPEPAPRAAPDAPKREEWEYNEIEIDPGLASDGHARLARLGALGKEGWQLAAITPHSGRETWTFKRIKV